MRRQRTRRQGEILEILEGEGSVRVEDLHRRYGVSRVTLRADLSELESQGLAIRTRGGAVRARGPVEMPFAQRAGAHAPEKERIGAAAAQLVADGGVVILDCGTTTLEVARHLAARPDVSLITNDLNIGMELCRRHHPQGYVLGGTLSTPHRCLVGPEVESALSEIRADRLFLGTDAVTDGRLMERSSLLVPAKQAMIRAAREVVLVADSSKFGQSGLSPVCDLSAIHRVVTDEGADLASLKTLAPHLDVIVAAAGTRFQGP